MEQVSSGTGSHLQAASSNGGGGGARAEPVKHGPPPLAAHQRSLIPRRWGDDVRALGIAEHKEAALSLAQAFAADDLAMWLVEAEAEPDSGGEARWRIHVDIFNYLVAAHCYKGIVTTIGPDYEGVALWMGPGQNMDDWLTTLRSGMWRLWWQLSAEGQRRFHVELMPLLHDTKLEVMGDRDDDCYYLVYLGTKPSGRGRGYARKLIEQMAVKADAEGRAMYLESSSALNNAYYAKFGFEAKKDIFLGPGPASRVQLTIMVREPRPKQQHFAHSIPIKLSGGFKMM